MDAAAPLLPSPVPLRWRRDVVLALLALLAAAWASSIAVFAQEDAKRDSWQRPEQVMDALGLVAGSRVADVGCGEGYFVVRLARRVGSEGRVYGVDVDEEALRKLRRRVRDEGLANVEVIEGKNDDPLLPAGSLDAILVVNAYHEMREYDAMLRSMHAALKPGGRLVIIDAEGRPENDRAAHRSAHTIAERMVREDAVRHGLRFLRAEPPFERPDGDRDWFFLVFEKPAS
jgi:predicted methyltransferase